MNVYTGKPDTIEEALDIVTSHLSGSLGTGDNTCSH